MKSYWKIAIDLPREHATYFIYLFIKTQPAFSCGSRGLQQ